ncbi:MAG: helix-turn-helix transcriptional regulator [Pseudomonadota bacterium]
MLPFAETVLAWRLFRGLTQAQLARAAGVPRPNLSAVERGEREVTLKTLRALAAALDVRPGVLADGEAPTAGLPLGRASLERIARAAAGGTTLANAREHALARGLAQAMSGRLSSVKTTARTVTRTTTNAGSKPATTQATKDGRRRAPQRADRAYFFLRTTAPAAVIASLVERTSHHRPRP